MIPGLYQNALSQYNQGTQNQYNLLNALTSLQSGQQQSSADQLNAALSRVKTLGYVDSVASSVLGVPEGTQSADVMQALATLQNQRDLAAFNQAAQTERTQYSESQANARNASSIAGSMARIQEQIKANKNKPLTEAQIIALAQKDPMWPGATTDEAKLAIIEQYRQLVQNSTSSIEDYLYGE